MIKEIKALINQIFIDDQKAKHLHYIIEDIYEIFYD